MCDKEGQNSSHKVSFVTITMVNHRNQNTKQISTVWVAGKTVRSPRYTPAISKSFRDGA